ncbi:hypothetical protein [Pseudoalteromonas sp. PS5]|uniref:hypothetical protein n=1 Tax=Pseudoalteromonas sp. PS5 TaxID=1437473 RepID=UPI000FFE4543|nr:hypothetical protein [Pseudoalteromonas sp. PS5]RXE99595.1 hypothetical protein D9603_16410 [Pseudoalteromonas sp. PS5]
MIQANTRGELTGRFKVPNNVPAGTKLVRFIGKQGSAGSASYTGSGIIEVETLRRVNNIITQRFDPLAQTFILEQSRFIAGVELWFTAKGPEAVEVQIREVVQGIPTQTVLASSKINSDEIKLNDRPTPFTFTPTFLNADQEYALVVLTDGAEHSVAIAELGKLDQGHNWVTSQPYQVGVLLSSSNASTWTPHQDKDLTFRLKAAKFTAPSLRVELGSVDVEQVTDLMLLAVVQRPSAETQVAFELTYPSGNKEKVLNVQEWQPSSLGETITGKVKVSALLTGTQTLTPLLFAGTQCVHGQVADAGDYISRELPCRLGGDVMVTFEANIQSHSEVQVLLQKEAQWLALELDSSSVLTDGWQQFTYRFSGVDTATTRVKLVLKGTPSQRPRVRNLRAFTL